MSKPIALGDSRSADLAQRADAPGPAGPSRSPAWKLAKLSPEQRIARGKAERAEAPRSSHGRWEPAGDRPDPISLLQEQAESRVPELVPIRYGRMLVSPGTFFRGAALIMASDLAATPRSGVTVQLCGDAPLSNFGLFASPERQLMFDINDFDETLPGPWEWDVKRLAASFEVAGRDLGFAPSDRRAIVRAGVREYRGRMREAADMRTLDAWCAHMNIDEVTGFVRAEASEKRLLKRDGKVVALDIAKARTRDCMRVFAKRTANVDGEPRIVRDPPLVMPIEDLVLSRSARQEAEKSVRRLVRSYRRTLAQEHHPIEEFRYVHMARKVVGVGSVGTRCWIFLMEGRDHKDPLFLQAKEAQASVLERFVGKSKYANHGQGIVAGPDRDRVLPGPRWLVRPCDRGLLRRLRRPERAGPRSPGHSREIRAAPRADRFVASTLMKCRSARDHPRKDR